MSEFNSMNNQTLESDIRIFLPKNLNIGHRRLYSNWPKTTINCKFKNAYVHVYFFVLNITNCYFHYCCSWTWFVHQLYCATCDWTNKADHRTQAEVNRVIGWFGSVNSQWRHACTGWPHQQVLSESRCWTAPTVSLYYAANSRRPADWVHHKTVCHGKKAESDQRVQGTWSTQSPADDVTIDPYANLSRQALTSTRRS